MATIVIEGPDESGKTTLAQAIQQAMPGSTVIHSPVSGCLKDRGSVWFEVWSDWMDYNYYEDGLIILDRTPEISEAVYGVHRRHTRGKSLTRKLGAQVENSPEKWYCFVFCEAPLDMAQGHVDATGDTIYHQRFLEHKILYEFLFRDLSKMAIEHRMVNDEYPSHFQVLKYNRFDPVGAESAKSVWWQIRNFLQGAFPDRWLDIKGRFDIGHQEYMV